MNGGGGGGVVWRGEVGLRCAESEGFRGFRGQPHGYFPYFFSNVLNLYRRDLARAEIVFRLQRKQNKMNFERKKIAKISFFYRFHL